MRICMDELRAYSDCVWQSSEVGLMAMATQAA